MVKELNPNMLEMRRYGPTIVRHKTFWMRKVTDRPLLGCNLGMYVNHVFPSLMAVIPEGRVKPDDISTDLFLEDCESLYRKYQEVGDDYPYIASPFPYIPWMEAIMGCPIKSSPTSFWAEPCVKDWEAWHQEDRALESPWAHKLLELMQALLNHSRGRFPVAPTLMRGPSDIVSAMGSVDKLPLDLIDFPEVMRKVIKVCADVWVEIGKAQLDMIPDSDEGYLAGGHGLRTWAPDKVIWLQEDAIALLSPKLYNDFFLSIDRQIADKFPATAFHLHSSALWAIDHLVEVPEIDVLELNFDSALCDIEGTFSGWKKIHAHKPLVMWLMYEDGFWDLLNRILVEFQPNGLSIQVTVKDVEEGKKVKAGFFEAISRKGQG